MPSGLSNIELITRLNNGDEAAFAYLYDKYNNAVFANICKLIKKREQAKDILQEVFILLWSNRRELSIDQEVGGWLFTTSYYKSLEFLRESMKKGVVQLNDSFVEYLSEDRWEDVESNYIRKIEVLYSAIELLPPQKKAAFKLCRIQGMSYEVAATELGVSVETIKGYVKESVRFIKNYALAKEDALPSLSILCLLVFIR